MEVGQVCLKIAGRDAGKKCVVLSVEKNLVLIDGETRRRKVNVLHVFPINQTVNVKKEASHQEVVKALGITELSKQKKEKKAQTQRPKNVRVKKTAPTGNPKPRLQLPKKISTEKKTEAKKEIKSEKKSEKKETSKK